MRPYAVTASTPVVALREDRITAYALALNLRPRNHAVAETEEDMKALLLGAAAMNAEPLSFLLPVRQASFFRWCLLREDAQAISSTKSFPDLPDLAPPRSENDRGGLFGEDKKPEELRAQWRRAARSHAVWNGAANQKFPTGYGFYLWLV